jgi:hypothetical protein
MAMEPLVKPVTCRGCGGNGYIHLASGSLGHHFICDGTGLVESDRKAIRATKEKIARRGRIITTLQDLAQACGKSYRTSQAIDGYDMLCRREPERAVKAEASIYSRHSGVFLALADYYLAHRDEERAEREAAKAAAQALASLQAPLFSQDSKNAVNA